MVGVEVVEAGVVFKEGRSGKEMGGKAWLGLEFKGLGACVKNVGLALCHGFSPRSVLRRPAERQRPPSIMSLSVTGSKLIGLLRRAVYRRSHVSGIRSDSRNSLCLDASAEPPSILLKQPVIMQSQEGAAEPAGLGAKSRSHPSCACQVSSCIIWTECDWPGRMRHGDTPAPAPGTRPPRRVRFGGTGMEGQNRRG